MDHWKYIRHLLHLDQELLSGEMGSDGTLVVIYDESFRRYKSLLDVADGVQVRHIKSAEAKYLLTQHDDSNPIPGVHLMGISYLQSLTPKRQFYKLNLKWRLVLLV